MTTTAGHLDFSVGNSARGHIDHDGRLVLAGEGDGDRVGAEPALGAPQGRDQTGETGHGPADQVAIERLQDVVAGNAEMVGVAHADPAGTGFLRHVHGHTICLRTHNQAQAVVAIQGCGAQR